MAVDKLTEKYFICTIVDQLKAYIMLQLSYLTAATKVFYTINNSCDQINTTFRTTVVMVLKNINIRICGLFIGFSALSQDGTRSACRIQLSVHSVHATKRESNVEFKSKYLVL